MTGQSSGNMRTFEPIAITGIGCRFPGGADTPARFWDLLTAGGDAIVEVPQNRWSIKRFYSADPTEPGKMYVRRAGFLREPIDLFGVCPEYRSGFKAPFPITPPNPVEKKK